MELVDGSLVTGPPKSEAGKRIVTLPPFLLPELVTHLEQFTAPGDDSLVFVGPKNGPLRRPNFSRAWRDATESAGLTGVTSTTCGIPATTSRRPPARAFAS